MFHASSLAATRPISAHVWRTLLVACATGPALAGAAFACFAPLASAPAMFARPLTRRGLRPRPNREPAAAPAPPAGDPRPRKARARAPRSALLALAPAPAWRAACGPRCPRALARRLAVRAAAIARATHMCHVRAPERRARAWCAPSHRTHRFLSSARPCVHYFNYRTAHTALFFRANFAVRRAWRSRSTSGAAGERAAAPLQRAELGKQGGGVLRGGSRRRGERHHRRQRQLRTCGRG